MKLNKEDRILILSWLLIVAVIISVCSVYGGNVVTSGGQQSALQIDCNGCITFNQNDCESKGGSGKTCIRADDSGYLYYRDGTNDEEQLFIIPTSTDIPWTTFTPTLTLVGGSGNTVPEYSTNSGRYRRIGDIVFVDVFLDADGGDEGAGSGVINIALPVAAGASKNDGDTWKILGTMRNSASEYTLHGIIPQSGTTITLLYNDTATNISPATGAQQNNSTRFIRLHFWYEV